jgi:hypothetical protein
VWPFLAILGGVLANEMQANASEEQAKKQQVANMRMQLAREISPDVPTYGYQAAQARSQMAAQRDAGQASMIGSLLPVALQGLGQMSNTPPANPLFRGAGSFDPSHQGPFSVDPHGIFSARPLLGM